MVKWRKRQKLDNGTGTGTVATTASNGTGTRKLDCYEFGRRLVETGDLDPIYVVLHEATLEEPLLRKWLLAYWAFYHAGTASWICDRPDYWAAFLQAAGSKDWPRCPERRHFRGKAALASVSYLRGRGVEALFQDLLQAGPTAVDVIKAVRGWHLFGPWIGFKVADMLERLGIRPVAFDLDTAFYDGSPKKGAELLWDEHNPGLDWSREEGGVTGWAAGMILTLLDDLTAPPRHERPINVQEAETVCCKWSSYMKGHYYLGEDIAATMRALAWGGSRGSKTAQRLFQGGRNGGLW